tara:strand:+ start:971 stop:2335 length:1365 start_codon:yes stop_codon:yes gene_type:complete
MKTIKILKEKFKFNFSSFESSDNTFGLSFFHLGILLLAAAPLISFFLLTISSIFGSFKRKDKYFNDKYNLPFILAAILMFINCVLISLRAEFINNQDPSLAWIGILNWIPFFWCFWSFQIYLKNGMLRIKAAKYFIIGTLPVLFSGFTQYFLGWYGPYEILNKLIIWYQRPLNEGEGVTGLFNNYNYSGAWLSIILPLIIGLFFLVKNKVTLKSVSLILIVSCIYMIILTTSRNALLAVLITLILLIPIKRFKFLLIALFTALWVLVTNLIPIFPSNLQNSILTFFPSSLLQKTVLSSQSEFTSFPRIDLWLKSIELIKSNLLMGYGGGSFSDLYHLNNGQFEGMQHSHNIILEIAFNYGLPSSFLIVGGMLFLLFKSSSSFKFNQKEIFLKSENNLSAFNNAWITSFIVFIFLQMFDITYFDGRISLIAWILLSGIRKIIEENNEKNKELGEI